MSSTQRKELESEGSGEAFRPHPDRIHIAEDDPTHPHHHEHMLRVRDDDPDNVSLYESMSLNGWVKGSAIVIHKDGDRYVTDEGRRRMTTLRRVNVAWKKARDPRYPLRPIAIVTDDPAVATAALNSNRKADPPMVVARRFVDLRDVMGANKAAALLGLTLANANLLAQCLTLPASAQAQVNRGEVPADVAARASKKGGAEAVAAVVEAGKGADGKVEPAKVRAAAKELPKRPKAVTYTIVRAMADRVARKREPLSGRDVAKLLRYVSGDREALKGEEHLLKVVSDAEAVAKDKGDEEGAE